jgi:hypothetical protein
VDVAAVEGLPLPGNYLLYVRCQDGAETITTNTVEGYYSIFKRGMKRIYPHCGEKHLHRYLAELISATATASRLAWTIRTVLRKPSVVRPASGSRIVPLIAHRPGKLEQRRERLRARANNSGSTSPCAKGDSLQWVNQPIDLTRRIEYVECGGLAGYSRCR